MMGDPENPEIVTSVGDPVVTPFAATWPSRNWTPTEKVTAGMMNSLRDQLNELHTQVLGIPPPPNLAPYAPLASPVFTGNPTAPTPAAADWDTSLATTAFVQTEQDRRLAAVWLTDAATIAIDVGSRATWYRVAIGASRTLAAPTNPVDGQKIILEIYASGGLFTLTLTGGAGGFKFGTDIPTLTPTPNGSADYIGCVYSAWRNWWAVVAYAKGY